MKNEFIRANKCKVGEVYYLCGMWYQGFVPLINTPVKFLGKDNNSNVGLNWYDCKGQHKFEFVDEPDRYVHTYSNTDMLIKPIEDPEILR